MLIPWTSFNRKSVWYMIYQQIIRKNILLTIRTSTCFFWNLFEQTSPVWIFLEGQSPPTVWFPPFLPWPRCFNNKKGRSYPRLRREWCISLETLFHDMLLLLIISTYIYICIYIYIYINKSIHEFQKIWKTKKHTIPIYLRVLENYEVLKYPWSHFRSAVKTLRDAQPCCCWRVELPAVDHWVIGSVMYYLLHIHCIYYIYY